MKEIILGENIRTIAENAFYNCSVLESVTLPDGVTSIGDSAFQGCRELKKVNIPAGVSSSLRIASHTAAPFRKFPSVRTS
ncbi:MAG: leucine-rich repeat domain-containing protein [Oscillospiraceae bacterium]|nr:MAG: leucine-rich repeat domain-containing protein [Oscillospiraceae bacterium]